MPSTINASSSGSGGLINTGDASGQLELQANGSTKLTVSASGVTIPTLVGANVNLASNVTGTLPVANGGTGATTLTSNNVILGNGTSAVQFVAPGTNGNVLTSNGTTWQSTAPAAGGSWIYLSTVTASASTTLDIETTFSSTYDMYAIVVSGLVVSGSGVNLRARLKISGAYDTANYKSILYEGSSAGWVSDTATAGIQVALSMSNAAGASASFVMYINNPSSTSLIKTLFGTGGHYNNSTNPTTSTFAGINTLTGAVTGVRLYPNTGTLTSGSARLYGIKNS